MNTLRTEGEPQENTNINPNKKKNFNIIKSSYLIEKIKKIYYSINLINDIIIFSFKSVLLFILLL